jgi:hypothetical protein
MSKTRQTNRLATMMLVAIAVLGAASNKNFTTASDPSQTRVASFDGWQKSALSILDRWKHGKKATFAVSIHVQVVQWKRPDGAIERVESRSKKKIMEDLGVLNEDFAASGISFVVKEFNWCVEEVPFDPDSSISLQAVRKAEEGHIIQQAFQKPLGGVDRKKMIEINYLFGIGIGIAGLAEIGHDKGGQLWIAGSKNLPQILSHEMGHHFGLKHTFDTSGDDVDDTPEVSNSVILLGSDDDPNKMNIMTYAKFGGRTFTPGQIEKIKRHAVANLSSEYLENEESDDHDPDPDDLMKP